MHSLPIGMHTRVTASSVLVLVPHSNRCSFPLVSGCVKSDGDSSDSGGWSEEEGSEEDNVSEHLPRWGTDTLHSADTTVQCPVSNVQCSMSIHQLPTVCGMVYFRPPLVCWFMQAPPSFPELTQWITQSIAELGGKAFPKLNWSSPRVAWCCRQTHADTLVYLHTSDLPPVSPPPSQDAAWVNGDNTLQCTSPADVYLLLKSSDFIQHDLSRV